jgi:CubicO group peptidase (beta-lactamase class C family)
MLNLRRIEERVEAGMAAGHIPGVALGILSDGELVYARGFGVTSVEDGGMPVSASTLFRIGSVTKPITGTIVMSLVEQGRLDLDQPVVAYLPWFELSDPVATRAVTLRHLLSHTAGIPTAADHHGSRDPGALMDYVRREVPKLGRVATPGRVFCYSNPGVCIAGLAAEVVTGTPYTELAQQIVFGPLGMGRTTFDTTVAMTYPLAQSHELATDGTLRVDHRFADNAWGNPSGFAMSTVEDLSRLAAMFLGAGAVEGTRVLAKTSVAEMMRPQARVYRTTTSFYGLTLRGEDYKGQRRLSHGGGISSFGTSFELLPDVGAGVIVFANWPDPGFDYVGLINSVFDELAGLPAGPDQEPDYTAPPAAIGALAGVYAGEAGIARITRDGRLLQVDFNGRQAQLAAQAPDLWVGRAGTERLSLGVVDDTKCPQTISILNSPLTRTDEALLPPQEPADPLETYTGTYRYASPSITADVSIGADELMVRIRAAWVPPGPMALIPLGGRRFGTQMGAFEFSTPSAGRQCQHLTVAQFALTLDRSD